MIIGLYVVYDNIAQESGPVFQAKNDAVAIRQTVNLFIDQPAYDENDYRLVKIAEFNTDDMALLPELKDIEYIEALNTRLDLLQQAEEKLNG